MNKFKHLTSTLATLLLLGCQPAVEPQAETQMTKPQQVQQNKNQTAEKPQGKIVIYQAFTRLFGNSNSTNQPWGTVAQNGVGKFNDINDAALLSLKAMGVSHLWLTGVPHHALVADYSAYGISQDDPDVVKGRAGSPYAVKDYYSVNPDLAVDPAKRMDEFKALLSRAHQHGIKVMIDIVPNHVARHYQSLGKPEGVRDFGADDNTSLEYHKHNNFYYVPGQAFVVPDTDVKPLGGEPHPLADGKFAEMPAKWTGNGARSAKPDQNDWYETVKINYGVKPDGSYDFDRLPAAYNTKSYAEHAAFWQGKELPDSWLKFRDITQFWLDLGVDGFRYDMAEMVPVEFWSYLNSQIKLKNPDAVLLAEVYQPALYRDYVGLGKMDYLYDKVGVYDSLKLLMQGKGTASDVLSKQAEVADIDQHMLKFLENHDEQRIASPEFAGSADKGKPAMVVSALIGKAPTLIYFGQEVGEAGALDAGFGKPSRTSIFDYVGVPAHQGWLNGGKYDGGGLTAEQQQLREFYQTLLSFSSTSSALQGEFYNLHQVNLSAKAHAADNATHKGHYSEQQLSFARWNTEEKLIVVANFADTEASFSLKLPADLLQQWNWPAGDYQFTDVLTGKTQTLKLEGKEASQQALLKLQLAPLDSVVLQYKAPE
ncbi:MAG TPA: alpha-amylase [Rheinheimera sp.]|uniref:alpha-amylase family glycosyl hydrolase n=1 Tax=Rheinheimera sp. TaxID=1869214 RepID=UPI000EDE54E4|nr:alpha-amylase family glycosyl hydrolase [Rheinheimera sp.]HCU66547.1 alpha-amylase [Rheinheimera sp.]